MGTVLTDLEFFILIHDDGFGGDEHRRQGCRVLKRQSNHFGRIDDALIQKIPVFPGLGIEPKTVTFFLDFFHYNRIIKSAVSGNLSQRFLKNPPGNVHAVLFIPVKI